MGRPKTISSEIQLTSVEASFPQIAAHFQAAYPLEACCVIASRAEEVRVFLAPNLANSPKSFFEINPLIFVEIEDLGFEVRAFAHSHPDGDSTPSRSDLESWFFTDSKQKKTPVFPGVLYLIASVQDLQVSASVYRDEAGGMVEVLKLFAGQAERT
jgi:proteasome lid subunit RPN8/RPN11